MKEIKQNIQVASFDSCIKRDSLTVAQKNVCTFLQYCIDNEKVIDREAITILYVQHNYQDKIAKSTSGTIMITGFYGWARRDVNINELPNDSWVRQKALQWFKGNLASAIFKGKLTVLPVIEV